MTETAKVLKSQSSKGLTQKFQYATSDLICNQPIQEEQIETSKAIEQSILLSERDLCDEIIEFKDSDFQSTSTKQMDDLSNFGKHTPQSRKTYQTPVIHVQLVKAKTGLFGKLHEQKELKEKEMQISHFDPSSTFLHQQSNDKENTFKTAEKKIKSMRGFDSNQKTPKQQCFHKYLNCQPQPGNVKHQIRVKTKRSAQEVNFGKTTTAQHFEQFLFLKENNNPISPLMSKQNSVIEQPYANYSKNIRRSSFVNNSKRSSGIKSKNQVLTDRSKQGSLKDSLFEEMITAKLKYIDSGNRQMTYSRLSEQATLQKIIGAQISQNPTHQNSIQQIPNEKGSQKRRQTSHSRPKEKNIKNIDEEIVNLLKEYDKRNQVSRTKASYTRTDLLKLLRNFDMDYKSQEKRIKEYVSRMESTYCEKISLDKQCKEMREKLQHLTVVASKYASKDYIDSLVDGMSQSYSVLKQLGISIGFFLSMYKELEDYEDFQFMNENPYIQPLSELLQKYNLQEIYTDIDQVQDLVDKCDFLVHDNLLALGKITQEIQRSKSSRTCRDSSLTGFQQLLAGQNRPSELSQKRKCYHENCLVRNDKTLNKEMGELRNTVKQLRRELYQKEGLINQFKKKIDMSEEVKQMAQKLQEQEEEIQKLKDDQVVKVHIEQNQVSQVVRNQREFEQLVMQNNYYKEREKQLLDEIKEIRGLMQNEKNFKQVEKTLKQISGILVSNVHDLNLSDPQMRQFLTLFNFYDQALRHQTNLKNEFEQSGKLIDLLMSMFTFTRAKLKGLDSVETLEKFEAQVKDIIFQRENRYKSFESNFLAGTAKSPILGAKGTPGLTTVSSSIMNDNSNLGFEEMSQISLRKINDHNVQSVGLSEPLTQDRSKSNDKRTRKQSIKRLKQSLNKMNEENLKLKSTIAEMKGKDQLDLKGKTQSLNFVNDILQECEDLKVFDI